MGSIWPLFRSLPNSLFWSLHALPESNDENPSLGSSSLGGPFLLVFFSLSYEVFQRLGRLESTGGKHRVPDFEPLAIETPRPDVQQTPGSLFQIRKCSCCLMPHAKLPLTTSTVRKISFSPPKPLSASFGFSTPCRSKNLGLGGSIKKTSTACFGFPALQNLSGLNGSRPLGSDISHRLHTPKVIPSLVLQQGKSTQQPINRTVGCWMVANSAQKNQFKQIFNKTIPVLIPTLSFCDNHPPSGVFAQKR